MNSQALRDLAAELQKQLDAARAIASGQPSGTAPVLLSDDRVATMIGQLTTLGDEADLHQAAFRKIYWYAARKGIADLAALALQYADLAAAPTPTTTL